VAGLAWNDSFKVPLKFLWDKDASGEAREVWQKRDIAAGRRQRIWAKAYSQGL
jgi:hypothetical protein